MSKIILAEGNTSNYKGYIAIPTRNGFLHMNEAQFLCEITPLSEGELEEVMYELAPYNQHTMGGDITDAIAVAKEVVEYGKSVINQIRGRNPDKDSPSFPGWTYPGLENVKANLAAGIFTYKDGGLYMGPNHPLTKFNPANPKISLQPVGRFIAMAPDEVIAAIDPDFKKNAQNVVDNAAKTGGSNSTGSGTSKGFSLDFKPGKGFSLDVEEPWYKKPEYYIPLGALGLFIAYKLYQNHNA